MQEKMKTAIILIGSGMRSAYSGGFLYALGKELDIRSSDLIIATSGAAGNATYFAAGQYESLKRIWIIFLPTRSFIWFARFWRIINIDYLIDGVFSKLDPLDADALKKGRTEIIVPLMRAMDGVFDFREVRTSERPLEILRAAKALPFYYGKRVLVDATTYIDGSAALSPQDLVDHALTRGARRIVVIDNGADASATRSFGLRLYSLFGPRPLMRRLMHMGHVPRAARVPLDVRLLYIRPEHLPAQLMSRDPELLADTFERGRRDALERAAELRTLLV